MEPVRYSFSQQRFLAKLAAQQEQSGEERRDRFSRTPGVNIRDYHQERQKRLLNAGTSENKRNNTITENLNELITNWTHQKREMSFARQSLSPFARNATPPKTIKSSRLQNEISVDSKNKRKATGQPNSLKVNPREQTPVRTKKPTINNTTIPCSPNLRESRLNPSSSTVTKQRAIQTSKTPTKTPSGVSRLTTPVNTSFPQRPNTSTTPNKKIQSYTKPGTNFTVAGLQTKKPHPVDVRQSAHLTRTQNSNVTPSPHLPKKMPETYLQLYELSKQYEKMKSSPYMNENTNVGNHPFDITKQGSRLKVSSPYGGPPGNRK